MFNVKIVSCSIVLCLAGLYSSLALAAAVRPSPTLEDVENAIFVKNHSVLKAFIEAEGKVNKPTEFGNYLLNIAADVGDVQAMDELIKAGANINAQGGREGMTPLMLAALSHYPDAVSFLLEHGADTRLQSKKHETALSYAQDQLAFYRKKPSYMSESKTADLINRYERIVTILLGAELPH